MIQFFVQMGVERKVFKDFQRKLNMLNFDTQIIKMILFVNLDYMRTIPYKSSLFWPKKYLRKDLKKNHLNFFVYDPLPFILAHIISVFIEQT